MRPAGPPSCLGELPEAESSEGAGLSVTELVWEMRWDRLGKVSEAEELRRGQGEWAKGEVGVMRPGGRGGRGEEGKQLASRSSICRMLWMTSPAPEHRSARSFFDKKHSAFPAIRYNQIPNR